MAYALLSVSDKTGLIDFAKGLIQQKYSLLSTGGTAKTLRENGIPVRDVSDYTGFPEMMDGRVKTLHPKIHGGLLCLRGNSEHTAQAAKNGVEMIDLVCVNLYPFEKTINTMNCALETAVENIDIGGPSMLRSAAKNYQYVTVVTDPSDYTQVLNEIVRTGNTSLETRQKLAVKVFGLTAGYDAAIHTYLSSSLTDEKVLHLSYERGASLRYGENPHQKGTVYFPQKKQHSLSPNVPEGTLLHGKEMSYNNYLDADASLEAVRGFFPEIAVSIIKHSNPCGLATGSSVRKALEMAWEGDIVSSFGSVISTTHTIDIDAAEFLKGKFVEVLIAPDFTDDALSFLKKKSKDIRIIRIPAFSGSTLPARVYRCINGALLEQDGDNQLMQNFSAVTKKTVNESEKKLYTFAYRTVKHVKSNAINLCYEYAPGFYMILGMGAGQPNRIDSLRKLAATKTAENIARLWGESKKTEITAKSVLASDAFFPFRDTIEAAHALGITKIIQPGGSVNDAEVIAACDELGISMICTGTRHFLH